jgi:coniferyl-aldehyde dehydrogenase
MENAAKNLTPVTLELGGKCPAIITENFPLKKAVERILYVKQFNAGQICTSVDYVFVPQSHLERFVDMAKTIAPHLVPDITSVGYTSIINDQAYSRIVDTVAEAEAAGCRIVALSDQFPDAAIRKYPLTLIIDPPVRGLAIEEREIFGPLLLVRTYSDKQQVIKYIQPKPWPLAIYPFTKDISLADFYIDQLMSGGVTVNDALIHVAQHDLPFGGVGASGMGHYHGYEGFLTFSKLRPVSYQSRFSLVRLFYPPYSSSFRRLFRLLMRFFN